MLQSLLVKPSILEVRVDYARITNGVLSNVRCTIFLTVSLIPSLCCSKANAPLHFTCLITE
jgi:hypothetical protein